MIVDIDYKFTIFIYDRKGFPIALIIVIFFLDVDLYMIRYVKWFTIPHKKEEVKWYLLLKWFKFKLSLSLSPIKKKFISIIIFKLISLP